MPPVFSARIVYEMIRIGIAFQAVLCYNLHGIIRSFLGNAQPERGSSKSEENKHLPILTMEWGQDNMVEFRHTVAGR